MASLRIAVVPAGTLDGVDGWLTKPQVLEERTDPPNDDALEQQKSKTIGANSMQLAEAILALFDE
jgi:hypothetical protein